MESSKWHQKAVINMVYFIKNSIIIGLALLLAIVRNVDAQAGSWSAVTSTTTLNHIRTWTNNGNIYAYFNQPATVLIVWSAFSQVVAGTNFDYWCLVKIGKKKLSICRFKGIKYPNTNHIHINQATCYDYAYC